jgi:hypothetical protein
VLADEVRALLDEVGLEHGSVLVASAGYQLWVETVSVVGTAGGVAGLTKVITTVINRHKGKRVVLEPGKTEFQGYSPKEVERFLQKRLQERKPRDSEVDLTSKERDEFQ